MGRFSSLAPGAGRYVNAADKAMLAELAVPLQLRSAVFQRRAQFGPRWLVDVAAIATGEMIAVDFADNPTRAAMFDSLAAALDAGESFDPVVLVRVQPDGGGNPFWTFEDATPEQIAANAAPEWAEDDGDRVAVAAGDSPVKLPGERLRKAARG